MLKDHRLQPLRILPTAAHVLDEHLADWGFVSAAFGYDGALYLMGISPRGAFVPKKRYYGKFQIQTTELADLHAYRVVRYTDQVTQSWTIVNQMMFYAFAEPLPEQELLLVCPAAVLYEPNLFTLNAAVFTSEGTLRCRFLLGDGIATVQTTSTGHIWVGYLDEGIYGRYGWGSSRRVRRLNGQGVRLRGSDGQEVAPIGAGGVREWDSTGRALYRYPAEQHSAMMADCYALNVVADTTVMLYYYPDFPLVCVHDHQIVHLGYPDTQVAKAVAMWRQWVLLVCEPRNAGIEWWLYELADDATMRLVSAYAPQMPDGQPLQGWVSARGDQCSMLDSAGNLYIITVEELLARSR